MFWVLRSLLPSNDPFGGFLDTLSSGEKGDPLLRELLHSVLFKSDDSPDFVSTNECFLKLDCRLKILNMELLLPFFIILSFIRDETDLSFDPEASYNLSLEKLV